MIGNDIVDWVQARRESNWQRRGFLDKLFTPDEQQLIHDDNHSEQMVWILWSLKESVYKANLRQTGKRQFAPKKIACQFQLEQSGLIEGTAHYDHTYRIKASVTQNYVSSVAVLASTPFVFHEGIIAFNCTDYSHQSARLRQFITQYCADTFSLPTNDITVQKNDQDIPQLIINASSVDPLYLPISLTHHGYHGAFVINALHLS